jgi:hypothetical protein
VQAPSLSMRRRFRRGIVVLSKLRDLSVFDREYVRPLVLVRAPDRKDMPALRAEYHDPIAAGDEHERLEPFRGLRRRKGPKERRYLLRPMSAADERNDVRRPRYEPVDVFGERLQDAVDIGPAERRVRLLHELHVALLAHRPVPSSPVRGLALRSSGRRQFIIVEPPCHTR